MSKINVNTWEPEGSGTTITAGASGDTLAISADSVTGLNVGSDAAGDVLYNDGTDYTRLAKPGTPADEVLTFATGASAPSWVAIPAGGITHASTWRLTADFANYQAPITSNLAESTESFGASMVESSGIFTFPVTGTWNVEYVVYGDNTNYFYADIYIQLTVNDSTYTTAAYRRSTNSNGAQGFGANISFFFNVTDVTQCKCRFNIHTNAGTSLTTKGDASTNETYMNFIRLGDST